MALNRRVRRRLVAACCLALAGASLGAVGLRTEPTTADYLSTADAARALQRATTQAGSDQIVGVELNTTEALFRIQRDGQVRTWAVRAGREISAVSTPVPAGSLAPVAAKDLNFSDLVDRINADEVAVGCTRPNLKAVVTLSRFPAPLTHVWCLDGAKHSWLGAAGAPIGDVDPRTAEGMTAGVNDLRRLTGARHVSYLAVRFGGEDAGIDLEAPGSCGDLGACDAVVASRRLRVQSKDPALSVREAPARINYAEMIDLDQIDPGKLHDTIEHMTQTRKGIDWWRSLTVTVYQRPGKPVTLEFHQGSRVFWTDLDGNPAQY